MSGGDGSLVWRKRCGDQAAPRPELRNIHGRERARRHQGSAELDGPHHQEKVDEEDESGGGGGDGAVDLLSSILG